MVKLIVAVSCLYLASAFERNLNGFDSFCKKHGKKYSVQEKTKKFETWNKNVAKIEKRNKENKKNNKHFTVGVNMFTDMTDAERRKFIVKKDFMKSAEFQEFNNTLREPRGITEWQNLAADVDWRLASPKILNAVKNQGSCGSCWTFATIATIEAQYALLNNGDLFKFSEQQLLDCDTGSYGCDGGFTGTSMNVSVIKGNALNSAYPYTGVQGTCKSSVTTYKVVKSFKRLTTVSKVETFVQNAGPAAFYMDVPMSLYDYESGIFDPEDWECDENNKDGGHLMAIVGYGSEDGIDYWIVRNSWGTTWGSDDGYLRIVKGVNKCGMEGWVYGPWMFGQTLVI